MTFYSTQDSIVFIALAEPSGSYIAQVAESKVNVKDTIRGSIKCGVVEVFKQTKKPNLLRYLKLGF